MFEMILVNVADELFYQKHDFSQQVIEQLSISSVPFAAHVAAPKRFSITSKQGLPVLISYKENTEDNDVVNTKTNGHFIFSNTLTSELQISKVYQDLKEEPIDEGKMDMPEGAPIGYSPLKTTYYGSEYKDISTKECPIGPGVWVLFEHSGSFISNLHNINIEGDDKETPPFKANSRSINPIDAGMSPRFTLSSANPPIPLLGFDLVLPSPSSIKTNQPLYVYGSFSIAKTQNLTSGELPIHLILSGKQFEDIQIISLKIPKDKITINNDLLKGSFSLDIMPIFYQPQFGNRTINDDFYITVVSGASVSKVFPVIVNH